MSSTSLNDRQLRALTHIVSGGFLSRKAAVKQHSAATMIALERRGLVELVPGTSSHPSGPVLRYEPTLAGRQMLSEDVTA